MSVSQVPREHESLCGGLFKRMPGFPTTFHLTQLDGIRVDIHSQTPWWLLFPALVLWAEEPGVVLGPFAAQEDHGSLSTSDSTATCGCGVSSFCISTSPTYLEVVSSLYPEL